MKKLTVQGSHGTYPIYIGNNLRFSLDDFIPKEYSAILIITDENVHDLYLTNIIQNITHDNLYYAVLPPGEQSKNIDYFYSLHTKALEYGLDRDSLIIALGGGVIGDIAGFVASTYIGVNNYIHEPTIIITHNSRHCCK